MANPNPYLPQRFKPGQSGNPKGRPSKGYSISDMMKEMIGNNPEAKKKLGEVIMSKALEGDMVAIKTLWQYMDGMPKQTIDANIEQKEFNDEQVKRIAERITRGTKISGDTSS